MMITGTFLDEISHDIPSNNWGAAEWAADFDYMQSVGIDTVILIRCGYRDQTTFQSAVLSEIQTMRPVYTDLVDLFLEQAERCGMVFFFGLYDSGLYWNRGQHEREVEINLRVTEEVADRYGHRSAFGGWYMSHEMSKLDDKTVSLYKQLTEHVRSIKDVPVLMSPYVHGRKQFGDPVTIEQHAAQWDSILGRLSGMVDILAFQDGQVGFAELPDYLSVHRELGSRHGMRVWSDVESFERGMPLDFLPIAWPNLRYKIEAARVAGVEKLVTFEFSHFMSPQSMYPSAHRLFERYMEWAEGQARDDFG